jgi:hypothetical protein
MQTPCEDKVKWANLKEATYNQAHGESQFLDKPIAPTELELTNLKKDQSAIFKKLVVMQKRWKNVSLT